MDEDLREGFKKSMSEPAKKKDSTDDMMRRLDRESRKADAIRAEKRRNDPTYNPEWEAKFGRNRG